MRACQVLRPRRVGQVLALARLDILPSTTQTVSAPGISFLSRLNGWPARSPADASPTSSRMPAHGLGPMWAATPSSQWTCTTYSVPVSRRTCAKTRAFNLLVESSSQFGQSEKQKCWRRLSEEGNRETGSTISWLAQVSHGLGRWRLRYRAEIGRSGWRAAIQAARSDAVPQWLESVSNCWYAALRSMATSGVAGPSERRRNLSNSSRL